LSRRLPRRSRTSEQSSGGGGGQNQSEPIDLQTFGQIADKITVSGEQKILGKVNLNIFQEHLIVLAHFMSAASLPQVSDLVNYFKISGDKRKADKQYLVDCIIMNRVSQPSIDAVTGFSHTNCAALLYDIAEDKIYFNQKDVGADAYAGYFQLNTKPKSLAEIFKPVADKFDVYYAKDIVANFGMSTEEVDKMLKHLTSQNKIFPVEIKKKSFSFA
jgi:hypothetical protein